MGVILETVGKSTNHYNRWSNEKQRVVTSRDQEVERDVLEKSRATRQTAVTMTATPHSILKNTFVTFLLCVISVPQTTSFSHKWRVSLDTRGSRKPKVSGLATQNAS